MKEAENALYAMESQGSHLLYIMLAQILVDHYYSHLW